MNKLIISSFLALLAPLFSNAEEVVTEPRTSLLQRADTWVKPAWMANDLSFSPSFNIKAGPHVRDSQGLLDQSEVHCLMTEKYATQDRGTGKSPKFNCDLVRLNSKTGKPEVVLNSKGKPIKLKVKYSSLLHGMPGVMFDSNGEVQAEVLATRFLSALGFTVDRMFSVKTLKCYGCSNDPWNVRKLDQATLVNPRVFTRVSVELKAEGKSIEQNGAEGWSYQEIMTPTNFSRNPVVAREQLLEREALLLIAGFIQHSDNKPDNHTLLCDGKVENGICKGNTKLVFHDLGLAFGGGTILMQFGCFPWCSSKAELTRWQKIPLWWDEAHHYPCTVNMGWNAAWKQPSISEEARLFVTRLLRKFVEGEAGYKRLIGLFETADLEASGRGSPAEWAQVFIEKVEEMENPALSDNNYDGSDPLNRYHSDTREQRKQDPPITCSIRLDNVVQKILRKQTK